MPIHDRARVDAGLFHSFRLGWISALADALNSNVLPPDNFALIEQGDRRLALGVPVGELSADAEAILYAGRADHIAIRHQLSRTVAVIEVVSPGTKATRAEL